MRCERELFRWWTTIIDSAGSRVSLRAGMCESAAPLADLAHKWTATCVCSAGACRGHLLVFGAHRDRILLRGRILLHMPRHHCRFVPVRVRRRLRLVRMLTPLCLCNSNGHRSYKQGYDDGLQHSFFVTLRALNSAL
jgi:hypothetical protein